MNEKFNKNAKVEQLTNMFSSRGEEKGLIVKDPYRLLMRSTWYHVDRIWYWLTEAQGQGLPIPEKAYMVRVDQNQKSITVY